MKIAGFDVIIDPKCPPDRIYFISDKIIAPHRGMITGVLLKDIETMIEQCKIVGANFAIGDCDENQNLPNGERNQLEDPYGD